MNRLQNFHLKHKTAFWVLFTLSTAIWVCLAVSLYVTFPIEPDDHPPWAEVPTKGPNRAILTAVIGALATLAGTCVTSFGTFVSILFTTLVALRKDKRANELERAKLDLERLKIEKQLDQDGDE